MPIWLQKIIPHHFVSRIFGLMANCRWVWFKNSMIHIFISLYDVDMTEANLPDYQQYPTFNAFFTRRLRDNTRTIASDPKSIVSPVDGKISAKGIIHKSKLIQAKGIDYSLLSLLAGKAEWAETFEGGNFFTAYLAPREYHRVHMPFAGQLTHMAVVPGRLYSVNQFTVDHLPHLFTRNERVICLFQTAIGYMAVILIGAMNVGSIHTTWHGAVAPVGQHSMQHWSYPDRHICLERGEELGFFQMGSTVVVLFEPNKMHWVESQAILSALRMGESIGFVASQ